MPEPKESSLPPAEQPPSAGSPRSAQGRGAGRAGRSARASAQKTNRVSKGIFAPFPHNMGDTIRYPGKAPQAAPYKKPSEYLVTEEQQEAFAQAVLDYGGIKPACAALGFHSASVHYWALKHSDFDDMIVSAWQALLKDQVEAIDRRNERLLAMSPDDMMKCANAFRIAGEQSIRILGKLSPKVWGDRPQPVTNIQNNNNILVDETTRQRLIALREQISLPAPKRAVEITLPGKPTTEEKAKEDT